MGKLVGKQFCYFMVFDNKPPMSWLMRLGCWGSCEKVFNSVYPTQRVVSGYWFENLIIGNIHSEVVKRFIELV
jgi:hypothetical protein